MGTRRRARRRQSRALWELAPQLNAATLMLPRVEEAERWRAQLPQHTTGTQQKPQQLVAQHLEQLVVRRRRTAARTPVQQATRRRARRRQSRALWELAPQLNAATLMLPRVEEAERWRAHFPQHTTGTQQKPQQLEAQHLEQLVARQRELVNSPIQSPVVQLVQVELALQVELQRLSHHAIGSLQF